MNAVWHAFAGTKNDYCGFLDQDAAILFSFKGIIRLSQMHPNPCCFLVKQARCSHLSTSPAGCPFGEASTNAAGLRTRQP